MKHFALGFTFCVLDALILTGCGGGGSSSGAAGAAKVVSRGLVFKDPNTGAPQMWAHRVRVLP